MNITLGILAIVAGFSALLLMERIFKKEGVYVWMAVASVTANILTCKTIDLFGVTASMGTVLFASNFLATDILSEKYGSKYSRRATRMAVVSVLFFIAAIKIGMLFIPSVHDTVSTAMDTLFDMSIRTSAASVLLFYISNMADIYLFEKLKSIVPDKLWLRNNVATILTNCGENFLFYGLAFAGIMDWKTILSMGCTATVIEMVIAICDTPFLYLARRTGGMKDKGERAPLRQRERK